MRFLRLRCAWLALLVLMLAPGGAAQAQASKVDALVKSMTQTLKDSKAFTFHAEKMFDVVLVDGLKVQYSGAMDVAVRRPDRLYVSYGDDLSAKEAWYDGTHFTLQDHVANVYGQLPAKNTIDETIDAISEQYGVALPLGELISEDAYAVFAEKVIEKIYVGEHDVGGRRAHHILFTGENVAWQLWIDAGDVPLPLKLVVTQDAVEGAPQSIFLFSEWDLAADLPDEDFVPEIPDGATLASFLPKTGG